MKVNEFSFASSMVMVSAQFLGTVWKIDNGRHLEIVNDCRLYAVPESQASISFKSCHGV